MIEELKLRILSSTHYVDGNEYELARHFDLIYEEIYFPSTFAADFDYEGKVPDFSDFVQATDSEALISRKRDFYRSVCRQHLFDPMELLIEKVVKDNLDI